MKNFSLFFIATFFCFTIISCSSDTGLSAVSDPDQVEEPEVVEDDLPAAPAFSLTALDGSTLSLDQFEDKTLVIFFFGYSCPPCISVAPTLESELNLAFNDDEDFAMIGIDVWDGNSSQVDNFKNQTDSSYPLGLEGSGVSSEFGSARDRLVVVNKDGNIAFSGTSVARNDLDEVKELVTDLLKD